MASTGRIPDAVLAGMLQRLAIAVSAGIDVRRAWASEAARLPGRHRRTMDAVAARLAAGDGFGDACAAVGDALPDVVSGMLRVGDRSGRVAEVLEELAKTFTRSLAARRTVRAAILGPAIRLMVALAAIVVVGTASGRGRAAAAVVLVVAAMITVGAVLVALGRRSWRRRGWAWQVGRRIPVIGSAVVAAEGAAWCRAAALAAHAGVGVGEMVDLASRVAPGVGGDGRSVEALLRGGRDLPEALKACGRLPAVAIEAVAVGEATGTTAEALARVADRLDETAAGGLAAAIQTLGFAAWSLVAALVAILVIRVFAGYATMIDDLTRPR